MMTEGERIVQHEVEADLARMDRLEAALKYEGVWDRAVRRHWAAYEADLRAKLDADLAWIAERQSECE